MIYILVLVLVIWVWYSFSSHNSGKNITFYAFCYKKAENGKYTFYKMGKVLGSTLSNTITLDNINSTVSYGPFINDRREFKGEKISGILYKDKVEFTYNGEDFVFTEKELIESKYDNENQEIDDTNDFFEQVKAEGSSALETGAHMLEIGQSKAALNFFESAVKFNPDLSSEIDIYLAMAYQDLGKPSKAVLYGKRAVVNFPKDANHHYVLGMIYIELTEYENAKKTINKAIALIESEPQFNKKYNDNARELGHSNAASIYRNQLIGLELMKDIQPKYIGSTSQKSRLMLLFRQENLKGRYSDIDAYPIEIVIRILRQNYNELRSKSKIQYYGEDHYYPPEFIEKGINKLESILDDGNLPKSTNEEEVLDWSIEFHNTYK